MRAVHHETARVAPGRPGRGGSAGTSWGWPGDRRRPRQGEGRERGTVLVLVGVSAWQVDHFATIAPALVSAILLPALTPAVLFVRRRYRHVLRSFTQAALLVRLVAVAQRYGSTA